MNLILTKLSFLIISINVHNVVAELKPSEVALSGLDVLTSLNNPIALFQSLSDFVSLIFSNGDTSQQDLSDIRNTLSDINNKLDDISEEIQGFREEVMNKLKELNIDLLLTSRLDEFFKLGEKLDFYYDRFKEVYKTKYSRALHDFINSVRSLTEGVRAILTKMHNTLSNDRWTSSAFRQLTDNTFVSLLVCSRGRSQQLIILNLYQALCAAEIKGLTMDLFAIKAQIKNKEEMTWEINNLQVAFTERSKHAVSAVKKAMSKASLEFWNCASSDPQEGVTFEKFGPFIYKSLEPEASLFKIVGDGYPFNRCIGGCNRFGNAEYETSCNKNSNRNDCSYFITTYHCPGYLSSCDSFDSKISICNTPSKGQSQLVRRYQYVEGDDGKIYGNNEGSCEGEITSFSSYHSDYWICETCLCTCKNYDVNIPIYVNLREVVSDVNENRVIVGVRFRKTHNLFHLQIQQAALLPSGLVDTKTKSWKKVNSYQKIDSSLQAGVDILRLTSDYRTFALDDIELDDIESVVTGVKLTLAHGLLHLEIRGHQFDYKQGKLEVDNHSWHNNIKSTRDLSELELHHLDLPSDHSSNPIHSYPEQYVKLTMSSLDTDVGQSIVPFVDIEPVESRQLTPLSGVGLFHKSHKNRAAGYLTLKTFTYNYEPYVKNQ